MKLEDILTQGQTVVDAAKDDTHTVPLPLDEQPVMLETLHPALARVCEAEQLTTWGDLDDFPEACFLRYSGVGRKQLLWMRQEIRRRQGAVRYTATGHVRVPPWPPLRALGATPDRCGVYFILLGPFVKIGLAKSVRKRFIGLQQTIPFQLELLGVVACAPGQTLRELERTFHQRFESAHQVGEWHRLEGDLKDFCAALVREAVQS